MQAALCQPARIVFYSQLSLRDELLCDLPPMGQAGKRDGSKTFSIQQSSNICMMGTWEDVSAPFAWPLVRGGLPGSGALRAEAFASLLPALFLAGTALAADCWSAAVRLDCESDLITGSGLGKPSSAIEHGMLSSEADTSTSCPPDGMAQAFKQVQRHQR